MKPRTFWTPEDEAMLRRLLTQGLHDRAIAERMGVLPDRVTKKRYQLGLKHNPAPRQPSVGYRTPTEEQARAENDKPWDPLPGMIKRRCVRCTFWFAAPTDEVATCPICRSKGY